MEHKKLWTRLRRIIPLLVLVGINKVYTHGNFCGSVWGGMALLFPCLCQWVSTKCIAIMLAEL
jgi:hypothetical protein